MKLYVCLFVTMIAIACMAGSARAEEEFDEEMLNELRSLLLAKRRPCNQSNLSEVCANNPNYGKADYTCTCQDNHTYYTGVCSCVQKQDKRSMLFELLRDLANETNETK